MHISHYLCISCPLGCRLEVEDDEGGEGVEVSGFTCKKGKVYGAQEHTDPRRMVTTTVHISGGMWPRLPVRTSEPVPKDLVRDICRALAAVSVSAPVAMGDVVVSAVLGTEADILAARDIEEIRSDNSPPK